MMAGGSPGVGTAPTYDPAMAESAVTQPVALPTRPTATCPPPSRFAVFEECPHCGGAMAPEHAHFRCRACGWRDSCCD